MIVLTLAILSLSSFLIFIYHSLSLSLYFPILSFSSLNLSISLIFDWTSLCFSSSVLLISASILFYSYSYIPSNEHNQFSLILICFVASIVILIFSNNLFFLILGWDGLGLSSYILVIYYQNSKSNESGALTILSNRVGDIFIILSISTMTLAGSWELFLSNEFPWLILILLTLASSSNSAQLPFSAWLPAAIAAPTPISALVHSSTLVTAGVFLMIRTISHPHPSSILIILIISFITLFFSGLSANWEQDLNNIIALSTLSQIAIIFFAVAINSICAAYSHLITHAFFNSTIFLCAGILIHNSSYQDLRFQSSSNNFPPSLIISFGICNIALIGLPFLSGFFSNDAIIENLISSSINLFIFPLSIFAIGLTVSYSSRLTLFSLRLSSIQKKDNLFHLENPIILPILFLTPISIFIGSLIIWTLFPSQNFILPITINSSIFTIITLGFISGLSLSFNSRNFNLLGESSISLWFLHFITCSPTINLINSGQQISLNDLSWIEIISAQGAFYLFKSSSPLPSITSFIFFMILSMLFISPIILFS